MTHLLGGRVTHDPGPGHRSGIEPVMLAASLPAKPGEFVIDAGTGSGAALLCLAARVPAVAGLGVELDAARAALAECNRAANSLDRLRILAADVCSTALPPSDHAMANPPWHDTEGTASPDAGRNLARRRRDGLLHAWAAALAASLRHRGTLTLVVSAGVAAEALAAIGAVCGSLALLPLWPRADMAAKLVLVRGVRGGRAPTRVLPGLVLHEADGRFTPAADAVLRDAAALPL